MPTIQINGLPLSLAFHAFDPHLVIANESDMVTYVLTRFVHITCPTHVHYSVWDWIKRRPLNRFFNGNPRGTSITSLHIINQDVGGIILTGAGMSQPSLERHGALLIRDLRSVSGRNDSPLPELRPKSLQRPGADGQRVPRAERGSERQAGEWCRDGLETDGRHASRGRRLPHRSRVGRAH